LTPCGRCPVRKVIEPGFWGLGPKPEMKSSGPKRQLRLYGLAVGGVSVAGAAELHQVDRRCAFAPGLRFSVVSPTARRAAQDDALASINAPRCGTGSTRRAFGARALGGFIRFDEYLRIVR
jgi:hypothetical protein